MHTLLPRLLLIVSISLSFTSMHAQNAAPYWSTSGNSNATTSSKLGTTNSIPLRLLTNNLERIRIDVTGKVGIGTTAPKGQLSVQSGGSAPVSLWVSSGVPLFAGFGETTPGNADFILGMASNTPSARSVFLGRKSRGTLSLPTAVQNNDYLLSLYSSAYDGGGNFQAPATVDFIVDGTVSSGHVPTRISFSTGSGFTDRKERLKVGSTGNVNFNDSQVVIEQSTGNVGIGTKTPNYKLDVRAPNSLIGIIASAGSYGVYATSSSTGVFGRGQDYGIYGSSDNNYGVYGRGKTGVYGSGSTYGVYGSSSGTGLYGSGGYGVSGNSTTGWGGLFAGGLHGIEASTSNTDAGAYGGIFHHNVYVYGSLFQTSDRRVKKNITQVQDAMSMISRLKPSYYEYSHEGKLAALQLPQGKHYGLIAQDLEEVLPELVGPSPIGNGGDTSTMTPDQRIASAPLKNGKGINYLELIPILIKGIQEQQSQIQVMDSTIQVLRQALASLTGNGSLSDGGMLSQNTPNPASQFTNVSYRVPAANRQAYITVMDNSGRLLQNIRVTGSGVARINTAGLTGGAYHYSLISDNRVIDTKQLLITR